MKIYIDLVFFIDFIYDLLILIAVESILKRNSNLKRKVLSSLIGSIPVIFLLFNMSKIILFFIKILTSIIMVIISFNFVSLKYTINNIIYMYMCSTILAGFLYYLSINVKDKFNTNYLLLLIISPLILFYYKYTYSKIKGNINKYYKLEIVFNNIHINCMTLLDNGNNLKDPVTGKSIIIINENLLKKIYHIRNPMYVPYKTVSGTSIMKCFKPSYILLNNQKIYNYLIGETNVNFNDGVNGILNVKLLEDNYV